MLHTSDDQQVIKALATAYMAFALPEVKVDGALLKSRKCWTIETKLNVDRGIECDSCVVVGGEENSKKITKKGDNDVVTDQQSIFKDIRKRGAVVFAEMQQEKVGDEEVSDTLSYRLGMYADALSYRDWGHRTREKSKRNIRPGKLDGTEISRSIVGVGYSGYNDIGRKSPVRTFVDGEDPSLVRGKSLAVVGLGRRQGAPLTKQNVESLKRQAEKLINRDIPKEVRRQVTEIFVIFSASHLLTIEIVKTFSDVAKKFCEILEVTKEKVDGLSLGTVVSHRDFSGKSLHIVK